MISVIIVLSHFSFLSKLTERVVELCLADYLSTNNLLNSFQSALSNIILLKLLFSPFMIISWKPWVITSLDVSLFLTYLLLLTLYTSLYSSWTSFILVLHFVYCSLLDQILCTKPFFLCQYWKLLNHLYSNFFMEFLKDPSLHGHLLFILLLTVLSYLILQQTTNSMLMILNFYIILSSGFLS